MIRKILNRWAYRRNVIRNMERQIMEILVNRDFDLMKSDEYEVAIQHYGGVVKETEEKLEAIKNEHTHEAREERKKLQLHVDRTKKKQGILIGRQNENENGIASAEVRAEALIEKLAYLRRHFSIFRDAKLHALTEETPSPEPEPEPEAPATEMEKPAEEPGKEGGFAVVEILVSMAILGILATLVVVKIAENRIEVVNRYPVFCNQTFYKVKLWNLRDNGLPDDWAQVASMRRVCDDQTTPLFYIGDEFNAFRTEAEAQAAANVINKTLTQ